MCNISAQEENNLLFMEPIQQVVDRGGSTRFQFEESATPGVGVLGGFQGLAANSPAGDHLEAGPAAVADGLQVNPAGKRRAIVPIWVELFPAMGTLEREQLRMLNGVPYEGAQVDSAI